MADEKPVDNVKGEAKGGQGPSPSSTPVKPDAVGDVIREDLSWWKKMRAQSEKELGEARAIVNKAVTETLKDDEKSPLGQALAGARRALGRSDEDVLNNALRTDPAVKLREFFIDKESREVKKIEAELKTHGPGAAKPKGDTKGLQGEAIGKAYDVSPDQVKPPVFNAAQAVDTTPKPKQR